MFITMDAIIPAAVFLAMTLGAWGVMSLIADLNNPRSGFLQTDRKSMHRLQQDLRPESGNR